MVLPAVVNSSTKYARRLGNALDDILTLDNGIIDDILTAQAKAKKGIFSTRPLGGTPREWAEVGTKLSFKELRKKKIDSLASRFSTESKKIKLDGIEKEFTVFKGSCSGSNEGYWATIKGTEDLYYIKYGDEAHVRSEILAGNLYDLGGIPSTKKQLVTIDIPKVQYSKEKPIKYGIATKFMPINSLPDERDVPIVREGFGMDCWLANWDALKSGNVVMSAGDAARLDVGGSLCFRARGESKKVAFGENVGELTSFFESYSHSKRYIKDMSRDELLASLDRVCSIPDEKISNVIDDAAEWVDSYVDANQKVATGIQNPEFLRGTLLSRKRYIERFRSECVRNLQKQGESIEEYIRRIDNITTKVEYKLNFEKIEMSSEITGSQGIKMAERLSPEQKKIYDESYRAYERSKNNLILRPCQINNVLTKDNMLHATACNNLDEILDNGITSGDFRGALGSGTGEPTQTPLCADFWDIEGDISIKDYFSRSTFNPGEALFLPRLRGLAVSHRQKGLVFVVNKNNVAPTLRKNSFLISDGPKGSILYNDGNMGGHIEYLTHRAVPIGVPIGAVDRIILDSKYHSKDEIQKIKDMIYAKGRLIKLYDLEGNLL